MIISNIGDKDEYWDKSNKLISKFSPVHKKGPKNNVENYRPVANFFKLAKSLQNLIQTAYLKLKQKTALT